MENQVPDKKPLSPLSASKAKVFESCSWLYWCKYVLKLPEEKNEGAKKGDVCHDVFELLINKKHHKHFNKVTKEGSVLSSPAIKRLVRLYIKKYELKDTQENWLQLDEMILVGLRNDFYVKGGTLVAPEYKFDITNEKRGFRIKGLMDKPFIVGDKVLIDDYKSSKKKFEGEDRESNLQALFYSYAATQIWPDKVPVVRFIFLQYPKNPMMEVKFTKETLRGFEYYLEATQEKINNFTEADAKLNFAADTNPPPNEFKGKLLCGFAKSPGQLKKDGTKMWHCPCKFPFNYFAVKKDGKVVYCSFKEENIKLKEGEVIEKMHYDGCPKHRNAMDDVFVPVNKSVKKVYRNIFDEDDF